ncbi:MAG: hypothetical protein EAX96_15330 [Candidatus Lokiarchaeota archaeon]|nr:hypothetical protein [Candidatus Lokiarchaeota archaeon]
MSGSWFPITDSNFIMDSNYTIQGYNHFEAGTYNATLITNLQTTGFNAGNYAANVSLNRTNNQYYDFLFPFTIRNNHTTSNLLNSEYQDYKIIQGKKYYQMVTFVNQSINLTTSYLNDEVDSKGIDYTGIYLNVSIYDGSKIEKTWNDFQYLGNGNYKITINNSDYEIGEYFVNISFRKQNYDWNFILINLTIDPFHSNLTFFNTTLQNIVVNNIITNWYQHNISFKIQWYSTIYNSTNPYFGINQIISNVNTNPGMIIWSIKDASNNTLIFGNNMIFDSITEMWKINDSDLPVPLKDIEGSGEYLEPGDYQLFVNISGLYLKNMTKIFIIKILPKAQTNIEISGIPADTQVATYINIKIKFTFDNQVPSNYYNIIVNLTLIIYYDDGRVVTQDLVFGDIKAQGTEQKQIFVEFGVNRISLRIFYYSDDQDWPFFSATNFDTNYISIEVGNIFKILVPILILGVIGICGFIGYSFYRTRIKQKREQKILDKSEKIFNYFNDLINIRKISMINKKNGEVLYNQNFNKADFSSEIQEDIIIKINNLGDKKGYYSSIDIIRHEGFIIIVDDSTYIRSAFIMKEFPTDDFIRGLIKFVQYYELNNLNEINKGKKLENGLETHALLEYIFDIGVIEPHRVTGKGIKMNLSSFQIELLSMAQEMSYDGYFFVSALFDKIKNESLLPEMSIFKEIMLLIQKKAIERIPYDDLSTIEIKYYEPEKDSIEKAIIQTEIESKSKDLRKDLTIKKVEDIKTKVEEFEEPISTKKEVSEEEILTPFEKMKLEYVLTPEEEKTLSELHESDLEIDLPLLDIEPEIKLPKAEDETDIKLPKAEDETDIKLPKAEDDED